jgi:NADP-dependent 3-hydroxy acid dehydrogenase YdfG
MASPKVFIVTGASKGLGAAITRHLLGQSHKVVLAARSAAPLEAFKTAHPGQVEYVAGDMVAAEVCGSCAVNYRT